MGNNTNNTATNNPYRPAPGSDPPALVGRDEELAAIGYVAKATGAGSAPQPIVLVGLRGMGKTALLRRAIRSLDSSAIVLSAEGSPQQPLALSFARSLRQATKRLDSFPSRLRSTIDSLLAKLPKASFELPHDLGAVSLEGRDTDQPPKIFVDAIYDLNESARTYGAYLVFAVDEIQAASENDLLPLIEFIHYTAGTETPALMLGAGLPNSRAFLHGVKTYTERWRYFRLELLDREQTEDALRIPAAERGVTIEDEALQLLAKETAGYPFFVQEYGSAAWNSRTGNTITARQVKELRPGLRRLLDNSLYEPAFDSLTATELRYVMALANLGRGPHHVAEIADRLGMTVQSANWIRNQIISKDVVYVPAKGLLEFRLPLAQAYVKRNERKLLARFGTERASGSRSQATLDDKPL